jgi:hypothetical protein
MNPFLFRRYFSLMRNIIWSSSFSFSFSFSFFCTYIWIRESHGPGPRRHMGLCGVLHASLWLYVTLVFLVVVNIYITLPHPFVTVKPSLTFDTNTEKRIPYKLSWNKKAGNLSSYLKFRILWDWIKVLSMCQTIMMTLCSFCSFTPFIKLYFFLLFY